MPRKRNPFERQFSAAQGQIARQFGGGNLPPFQPAGVIPLTDDGFGWSAADPDFIRPSQEAVDAHWDALTAAQDRARGTARAPTPEEAIRAMLAGLPRADPTRRRGPAGPAQSRPLQSSAPAARRPSDLARGLLGAAAGAPAVGGARPPPDVTEDDYGWRPGDARARQSAGFVDALFGPGPPPPPPRASPLARRRRDGTEM